MNSTVTKIDDLTLNISQEIHVRAPLDTTFTALLEQMGPYNETHDGKPLPMKIEARPGGRWFRDLGNDNGHFWGVVQAIKRPSLLEISGPLFMSFPVISNLQYRLTEVDGGTLISFRHTALGFVSQDHKAGMTMGWAHLMERVHKQAESLRLGRTAGN